MFLKSTYNEILKIASKPRSYIGIAAITLIICVILFAMRLDGMTYISFITAPFEQSLSFTGNILNGNLMAFIILNMLIIHVPLLIAFVTGDLISGEGAMGTIRLLLTKPISRTGILLSKYLAGCFYTLIVLLWMALLAIFVSKFLFGPGDLMVLKSDGLNIIQAGDVGMRFFYGFLVAYLALIMIATLSLTFSCFSDNSIGPIVSTMGLIILFTIIGTLDVPVFENITPLLFTTHMASWRSFFEDPIPVEQIRTSIIVLVVHIFGLLGIAIYKFNKKDILS
ncbi:MAG: ABC transporter permease subunit [Bacteroidetes bacterium]|jgi:ABC-2 type transport system permease protein|nr:ABC transporter permease subunit [Bacteroidota bacterium]MBK9413024.1 ABC transporter permease subunit [Bacteroidota bacterium]MBL0032244.1 ABC transporter permease subunit [Bacteroidota bacterium]